MSCGKSNIIRRIDKCSVNQICSGQVVLTLATAVKELVENSLDANATSIQIKLKEYGSECIEVVDNGVGVEEVNFEGLTLKHHTSKIEDFVDLETVETFGFRGEALSSLCALAQVSIFTRHGKADVGTRLRFNYQGHIVERSNAARAIGTTVTIENLFSSLPVRHKEFLRNLKREYSKLCFVLQSYSLLNQHCSFSCTNKQGTKTRTVIETRTGSLKDNISSIFGVKQHSGLLEWQAVMPDNDICNEFRYRADPDSVPPSVELTGYISTCAHGLGRSSPDRQFIYINSRPVDHTKITRLINEIYHQYNQHQYPFLILNVTVAHKSVDVNLVPDKRQMFLEDEGFLLASIKASLLHMYKSIPSTIPLLKTPHPHEASACSLPTNSIFGLSKFRAKGVQDNEVVSNVKKDKVENMKRKDLSDYIIREAKIFKRNTSDDGLQLENSQFETINDPPSTMQDPCLMENQNICATIEDSYDELRNLDVPIETRLADTDELEKHEDKLITSTQDQPVEIILKAEPEVQCTEAAPNDTQITFDYQGDSGVGELCTDDGLTNEIRETRQIINCEVHLMSIRQERQKRLRCKGEERRVKFFSKIEPGANERAEKELERELPKDGFLRMEIIGQFNRGFIIARLDNDLFIIDQHASDEKSNFEALSEERLDSQRLTLPQRLNVTAGNEELLQDRADVIKANGFDFSIDDLAEATQRVLLTAVPIFKGFTLGSRDLDELLFLLADAPQGQMCRPSKIHDILASKACRKSVMIGTALNHTQMRRIVDRMSRLQQPWNCPHGRPTIRHLLSLSLLSSPSRVSPEEIP